MEFIQDAWPEYQQKLADSLKAFDEFIWPENILFTYSVILVLATTIVYVASVSTLRKPSNAAEPDRDSPLFHPSDLEYLSVFGDQTISQNDAYWMPVMGGISLLSLYFAFKYFDQDKIQLILKYYFLFITIYSISSTFSTLLKGICRIAFNKALPHWRYTLSIDVKYSSFGFATQDGKEDGENKEESIEPVEVKNQISNFYFSLGDALGFPVALTIGYLYWINGHWILGNLIGSSLAITGIKTIRLDRFVTGFITLAGLFLYDIYFVFGTDVMITVATKIEVPVKLEVPRPISVGDQTENIRAMAMLGLGDIVIPAMFISLCLRYDLWKFHHANQNLPFHLSRPFRKPYFIWSIVAYVVGLITTISVMHVFKAGQPALLYLCPAIAGTTLIVAWVKNDFKQLYSYTEEDEKKETEKELGKELDIKEESDE